MSHSPELIEKLRMYAREAAPYIKARGGVIGHLEIALSAAAYAARDEEREACAKVAEAGADYALPQMAEFQRSIARAIRSRPTT